MGMGMVEIENLLTKPNKWEITIGIMSAGIHYKEQQTVLKEYEL